MKKADERREYERINIDTKGQFFIRTKKEFICEFEGIVINVSEIGLCVKIDKPTYERVGKFLEHGQTLFFHSYDEKGFSLNEEFGVFHGEGQIVRKTETEDAIEIGCQVSSKNKDFIEYVENKKVYLFVKSIRESTN